MRGMTATVCVSLALIVGIGLACGVYSHRISQEYTVAVERIAAEIRMENWEESLGMARALGQSWQERSDLLSMWVNHADVDAVTVGMAQFQASIEAREKYHSLLYSAELEEALALIYFRDAFALKNIL